MSGFGSPKGKRARSSASFDLSTLSTLNGGFAITKSNVPTDVVQILVVAVRQPDVARQPVQREVHLAERDRRLLLLLAEDGQSRAASRCGCSTNFAHWTNMPPEPHAGS